MGNSSCMLHTLYYHVFSDLQLSVFDARSSLHIYSYATSYWHKPPLGRVFCSSLANRTTKSSTPLCRITLASWSNTPRHPVNVIVWHTAIYADAWATVSCTVSGVAGVSNGPLLRSALAVGYRSREWRERTSLAIDVTRYEPLGLVSELLRKGYELVVGGGSVMHSCLASKRNGVMEGERGISLCII